MEIKQNVMDTLQCAVDTLSDVAHAVIEKNRIRAQANRLLVIIKGETNKINKAYIKLGKIYYAQINGKEIPDANEEILCEIIAQSEIRAEKARKRYFELLEAQRLENVVKSTSDDDCDLSVFDADEEDETLKETMVKKAEKLKAVTSEKAKKLQKLPKKKLNRLALPLLIKLISLQIKQRKR